MLDKVKNSSQTFGRFSDRITIVRFLEKNNQLNWPLRIKTVQMNLKIQFKAEKRKKKCPHRSHNELICDQKEALLICCLIVQYSTGHLYRQLLIQFHVQCDVIFDWLV